MVLEGEVVDDEAICKSQRRIRRAKRTNGVCTVEVWEKRKESSEVDAPSDVRGLLYSAKLRMEGRRAREED